MQTAKPAAIATRASGPEAGESYWRPGPANGHGRERGRGGNEEAPPILEDRGRAVIGRWEYGTVSGGKVSPPRAMRHMFVDEGQVHGERVRPIAPDGPEGFCRLTGWSRMAGDDTPVNAPPPRDRGGDRACDGLRRAAQGPAPASEGVT